MKAQHGYVGCPICHFGLRELVAQRFQMAPVPFPVGGIHHQNVLVFHETIEVGVIHGTPAPVRDHRVLPQSHLESGGIVGQNVLQKRQGFLAANREPPHVRHVEKSRPNSGGQVLLDDSSGELKRHVPAAELRDLGSQTHMPLVENRPERFTHS